MKVIKGQSLFEVVLALAVVTLITVAIVILSADSVRNSTFSKNKTLSSRYTQEAIEWLRNERDSDSSVFLTHVAVPTYCLDSLSWSNIGSCLSGEKVSGTTLTRQANFSSSVISGKNIVEAVVTVSWNDAQGYHEVRSTTNFSDTRQK